MNSIVYNGENRGINNSNMLLFAIIWMVAALVLFYANLSISTEAAHNLFATGCLLSYLLCLRNWLKSGCRGASLYVFFVSYAFMCNMGQSVLYLFRVPDDLLPVYFLHSFVSIVEMLKFQFLCIAALNLGTVLYIHKTYRCVNIEDQRIAYESKAIESTSRDKYLDFLMYFSLLYILYHCVVMFQMRQSMGYMEFFEAGRGQSEDAIYTLVDFLSVLLGLRNIFKKRHVKFTYVVYALCVVIYMIVGSRGLSMRYLAVIFSTLPITYPNLFQKKYYVAWIVGVVFGFAGLSVISDTRSSSLSASSFVTDSSIGMSALSAVSEMGYSERPAIITMEAVDGGYRRHQTILVQVIKVLVPFSGNLSVIKSENMALGNWVTDYVESNSGLGSSIIAEAYMNYGKFGWIFFILWGWIIAYGENEAYRRLMYGNSLYALWFLTLLSTGILLARSEILRLTGVGRYGLYLWLMRLIKII